jgi:integrase
MVRSAATLTALLEKPVRQSLQLVAADRADLEAFIGDVLDRRAASTACTYYKLLRIVDVWRVEEREIDTSPMARMKPRIVPEQPVPVVPEDRVRRLLKTCDGRDFDARRDTAITLLLLDIGPRRPIRQRRWSEPNREALHLLRRGGTP